MLEGTTKIRVARPHLRLGEWFLGRAIARPQQYGEKTCDDGGAQAHTATLTREAPGRRHVTRASLIDENVDENDGFFAAHF